MTLQIDLPEEQHRRLETLAKRLGMQPEELARAALLEVVSGPDVEFENTVRRVLAKNAELYQRLAR